MRTIVLYIATSLDGYIADTQGSVSWLEGDGSDSLAVGSYTTFIQNIDTVILGYNTYKQITEELSPDKWPYEGLQSYVITHHKIDSVPGICFTDEDLSTLLTDLKKHDGKDIWICGGASIAKQLLELKLIDKMTITVAPKLLGNGISLFDNNTSQTNLLLESTISYNGFVESTYIIKK